MTEEKNIVFLEECLKVEESAIPLYTRYIGDTLFLSGFTKEKQDRLQRALKKLREDSERHRDMLYAEINKLREGK